MAKRVFTLERDGFVGAYYGGPAGMVVSSWQKRRRGHELYPRKAGIHQPL